MKDFFILQDEITKKIVTSLQVELTIGEAARQFAKSTDNFEAWTNVTKGNEFFMKGNKEDNAKARVHFEAATKLDPEYPYAWQRLAATHTIDARRGWSESRSGSLKLALELAQKALALDDKFPGVHVALGNIYLTQRQLEKAIPEFKMAISLDPNFSVGYALLAQAMYYMGEFEESITLMKKALRLRPYYPAWFLDYLAGAYIFTKRYDEAIIAYNQLLDRCRKGECPPTMALFGLAQVYAELGRVEEARAYMVEYLEIKPKYSLETVRKRSQFKNPAHLKRMLDALSKAGLPEKPPLPLPDKPSIAVLPFVNMSDDSKQEYFSDGITEEIITAISKVPELFVIARNSSFTYKGKPVKVQKVGRDLGVKYVLEGSVRKEGDKIRVTAQLVDTKTGNHLWAERYDRDLKDIFAIQDEITIKIISGLSVELLRGGAASAPRYAIGTKSLQAYLKHLEARRHLARGTPEDYALTRKLSEEAIALDPEYPAAYNILAWTYMLGAGNSPHYSIEKAFKLAQKVVAMDDSDASAHALLGNVYFRKREYEKSIAEMEKAVALDPNYAVGYMFLAGSLIIAGRPQEAIPLLKKSMRLSPLSQTHASMCLWRLGRAYRVMGQYEEALSALKKAVNIRPNFFMIHLSLAATYIHLGREEEARAAAAEVRRIDPKFSLERFAKRVSYKDPVVTKRYIDALREAGLK
jgi:TolB-like protein/Flp pilus assembly protein TadD